MAERTVFGWRAASQRAKDGARPEMTFDSRERDNTKMLSRFSSSSAWALALVAFIAGGACKDAQPEPTPSLSGSEDALAVATAAPSSAASGTASSPPAWDGAPVAIALGKDVSCAITERGGVRCWGDDAHATLVEDYSKLPKATRLTPRGVRGIEGAQQLDIAYEHGCARTGEELRCFLISSLLADSVEDVPSTKNFATYRAGAFVVSTTDDVFRIWRPGARTPRTEPQGKMPGITGISARHRHGCAVTDAGAVRCFGTDENGKLKRGAAPVPRGGAKPKSIRAGFGFTCVVTEDGKVSCWGRNQRGQLGSEPKNPEDLAGKDVVETGQWVPDLKDVADLAAGGAFLCALGTDKSVKCWGENRWGQLGDDTRKRRIQPKPVSALGPVEQVACGENHACALTVDKKILCWGRNDRGQLGDGTTVDRNAPVAVSW